MRKRPIVNKIHYWDVSDFQAQWESLGRKSQRGIGTVESPAVSTPLGEQEKDGVILTVLFPEYPFEDTTESVPQQNESQVKVTCLGVGRHYQWVFDGNVKTCG